MCHDCRIPPTVKMDRFDWYGGLFALSLIGYLSMKLVGMMGDMESMARVGDVWVGTILAWGGAPFILNKSPERGV